MVEKIDFQGDSVIKGRIVREPNKELRLAKESEYDQNGILTSSIVINYDERGNEVKRSESQPASSVVSVQKRRFDSKGNSVHYSFDGELLGHVSKFETFSFYNENGDEIEKKWPSPSSRIVRYTYTYDAHCNWVKRVEVVNGIPDRVTIRDFEYFSP